MPVPGHFPSFWSLPIDPFESYTVLPGVGFPKKQSFSTILPRKSDDVIAHLILACSRADVLEEVSHMTR
jgi:hypothetical protein